jgi:G3E family GTPase
LIPVSVITGFLGSGKTTLISRILRDPGFAQTAVIVNEFGEIGLDHDLIASSDDTILTLNTGCLCCAVQTDLGRTLMGLWDRRSAGSIAYDRVVIETSGLTDPAPVLQSMMTDPNLSRTHQTAYVVTVVDTIHGETTLREHIEARHQIALADRVLLSKTDLQVASDGLVTVLDGLNPGASRLTTQLAAPTDLFGSPSFVALTERLEPLSLGPRHNDMDTFVVIRDRPLPALALTLLLQAVVEHCGTRLLRLKGLVAVAEMPERPAVIHGVRHVVSAPDFLDRWPSEDKRTRIVFITKGVPRYFVSRLLDAIEQDVEEEIAASKLRSSSVTKPAT